MADNHPCPDCPDCAEETEPCHCDCEHILDTQLAHCCLIITLSGVVDDDECEDCDEWNREFILPYASNVGGICLWGPCVYCEPCAAPDPVIVKFELSKPATQYLGKFFIGSYEWSKLFGTTAPTCGELETAYLNLANPGPDCDASPGGVDSIAGLTFYAPGKAKDSECLCNTRACDGCQAGQGPDAFLITIDWDNESDDCTGPDGCEGLPTTFVAPFVQCDTDGSCTWQSVGPDFDCPPCDRNSGVAYGVSVVKIDDERSSLAVFRVSGIADICDAGQLPSWARTFQTPDAPLDCLGLDVTLTMADQTFPGGDDCTHAGTTIRVQAL